MFARRPLGRRSDGPHYLQIQLRSGHLPLAVEYRRRLEDRDRRGPLLALAHNSYDAIIRFPSMYGIRIILVESHDFSKNKVKPFFVLVTNFPFQEIDTNKMEGNDYIILNKIKKSRFMKIANDLKN